MIELPLEFSLLLAFALFLTGFIAVLTRRNVLFMLMGLEIMINAAGLAFIVGSAHHSQPDGQVMFLFILAMAAAEVSVALALILQMHRLYKSVDTNILNLLKD